MQNNPHSRRGREKDFPPFWARCAKQRGAHSKSFRPAIAAQRCCGAGFCLPPTGWTLRWARGGEGCSDSPLPTSGLHPPRNGKGAARPFQTPKRKSDRKKSSRFAQRFFLGPPSKAPQPLRRQLPKWGALTHLPGSADKAPPERADFPRAGGKCRAATKGGVWHRAAMTERVAPSRSFPAAPPLPQEAGAAAAVSLYDPSRENGIAERPQALRYPEIINILSAIDAQSERGAHSNRPALGGLHHKIRAFRNAVPGKIALFQRNPPGGKIRVACALPRL